MAAAEILCPHCNSKQKVPEHRLAGAVTCLKCERLITDAYLYKVAPEAIELNVALKGKLVSEFGTTQLEAVKAKSDAYTGRDTDMLYESNDPTDREPPAFKPLDIHIGSGNYAASSPSRRSRVLTSAARTYLIGGVVLALLLVAGIVFAVYLMQEDREAERIKTTAEGNIRTLMHPNGREKARWTVAQGPAGEVIDGLYEEWWPSGKLKSTGTYKLGRKDGKWQHYHEIGVLAAEEHYAEDSPTGTWISWHVEGTKAGEGSHKDGERHGRWLTWYADNKLESQSEYEVGTPVGVWRTFHPNGELNLSGRYEKGAREGPWISLHDNGVEEMSETWVNGQREGPVKGQHRNRQPALQGQYAAGKRVGEWKWYALSGALARQGSYVDGREDGEWTEYLPDGQVVLKGTYRAGRREGNWEAFADDGTLESVTQYEAGVMKSEQHFYQGAEVSVQRETIDGETRAMWTVLPGTDTPHGRWREYHAGGTVALDGYYVNGRRQGRWLRFDTAGNVIEQIRFVDGVAQ